MENIINQHPDVRIELDYFKRMNEHYTLQAGNSSNLVKNQPSLTLIPAHLKGNILHDFFV
jgi:hypothetical protein